MQYVLCATFDPELALTKVSEMLALQDEPERLAEKLGLADEVERVKAGLKAGHGAFKRLLADMERIRLFLEIEKEIDDVKSGKWAFGFLGKGFAENKLKALADKRRKLGSLIEAPRWFYQQERVRLVAAIRDFALEHSEQGDAEWVEAEKRPITFPIVQMFEKGDLNFAKQVQSQLEKPLKDMDPRFILTALEGNRGLNFNFEKSVVIYYAPERGIAP